MGTTRNQNISNGQYTHPEALVNTDWIAQHLNDPNVRIIESNEDVLLYDTGHIPRAVHVDWHKDLNDQTIRDYFDTEHLPHSRAGSGSRRKRRWYFTVTSRIGGLATPSGSLLYSAIRIYGS